MEVYCTRPSCPRPLNHFADLDSQATLKTIPQKYCTACGLELLLLGRYFAVRLLGRGGFGAAYLARDRYTPAMRFCVVKQFQPSTQLTIAQLQTALDLFEREGQVLEDLGNHPQIPDLLAFFALPVTRRLPNDPDQFFYLVQEFIDGQNLEQELEQQGRFSEEKILELLQSILPVLQFVHDRGSIHRDIKPSNVMRRKDGALFLLDFGAVKQATAATPGQAQPSSTGIYSMGFAPPEQMKGDRVYPATDLYALAVTCLMLLTGEQPQELYDTYRDEWNWRSHVTVSDRLGTVLDRMLRLTPSLRYQSANEVLAALKTSTPVPPTAIPSTPPTPAPVRPASGHSAPSGASGTTLQKLAAVSPAPTPAAAPTPTPPAPARPPRPPRKPFSILEYLYNAAFTGFEGGLVAIVLASLFGTIAFTPTFWLIFLAIVGGFAVAQAFRWIERVDLFLIAAATTAAVFFLPFLRDALSNVAWLQTLQASVGLLPAILMVSGLAALTVVFVAIVFRLVYKLVARIL